MTLLACFYLLVGLGTALWLWLSFRPSRLDLGPPPADGPRPLVSLVVPMRNEEQNVDCCLTSVRAQDYPRLQVIVVNDNSTDGTATALARWKAGWPQLEVLRLDDRPPGWAGKTYPEHRGAEAGRGEWLLFMDADVELAADAISKVVAAAESRGWPMVSILGRLKVGSFWEAVLQLYMWAMFVVLRVELPRSALVGAFLLMRAAVYRETGGYAAFPGAVTSDVAFADRLVSRGFEPRVRLCPDAYSIRMYSSLREIWQGGARMLAGGTGFRASVIAARGLLLFVVDVAPLATLAWLANRHSLLGEREGLLAGAALFVLLVRWLAYELVLRRLGASAWAFLAKPLGDLAATLLFLDAALRTAAGHVTWRGHRYSKASVQAQGVQAALAPELPFAREAPSQAPSVSVVVIARGPHVTDAATAGIGVASIAKMAEGHPDAEFVVVAGPDGAPAGLPPRARVFAASGSDRYALWQQGIAEARGEVVAFADAACTYSDGWLDAVQETFADTRAQIVCGRTSYSGGFSLAKAGTLRDWGAMEIRQSRVRHLPEANFAARRELLLHYDFGRGFREWGGALALATLAVSDGIEIQYEPRMDCRAPDPYLRWSSAWDRLAARHAMLAEVVRRDLDNLGFRPLSARLLERFLPVFVCFSTAVGAMRAYRPARATLGIRGLQSLTVPMALMFLATVDWWMAQWAVLAPSWLSRKAQELGAGLSPEVDADPAHPLRRRVSQIAWALAAGLRTPLPVQAVNAGKRRASNAA